MEFYCVFLSICAAGCRLHLGVAPPASFYRLAAVYAPVAEPGIDEQVRAAVAEALAARGAWRGSGVDLVVHVERAELVPGRRGEAGLAYEARLVVRFEAGDRRRTVSASRPLVDPGGSAGVAERRARLFDELAREVAVDGITWLCTP